jgi:hypothetical protein
MPAIFEVPLRQAVPSAAQTRVLPSPTTQVDAESPAAILKGWCVDKGSCEHQSGNSNRSFKSVCELRSVSSLRDSAN